MTDAEDFLSSSTQANITSSMVPNGITRAGMPTPINCGVAAQLGWAASHESIPRSLDGLGAAAAQVLADWTEPQGRRLPSPVSDSGGADGMDNPANGGSPPRPSSAAQLSRNEMDVQPLPSPPPMTPSPGKRFGHTRSKHTLNSWTALQPGMKRSFSIGYRSDCEKCRDKVPGHFNHIIIS